MATIYTPESKIEDFYYNPNKNIKRQIFNSGFTISTTMLENYQEYMQDAVRKSSRDMLKWPGIASGKVPEKYEVS